jgi:hypothetical protein
MQEIFCFLNFGQASSEGFRCPALLPRLLLSGFLARPCCPTRQKKSPGHEDRANKPSGARLNKGFLAGGTLRFSNLLSIDKRNIERFSHEKAASSLRRL